MDADELVRALQALNVATSVQTVSDTRCVLNIENGISFAGVDGQISYRRKGSLAKLCAKFYASNISDEQIATIQLVKSDSCRIHAVRKGNDASIKIISVNSLQTDLNEQVSVLCAFSTQVLTIMLPSTPCTTLEFSEVLRFTPTEAAPHYVKTGNSSGVSSVIIEGSQADCAAFQQQIPPVLQPYFMWELQPGDAFNGIMCDMYPEGDGRPGPMEWIMSLFDKGIAFVSFPCKYLYYHSPVSDFRLLPAPLHLSDFQLTHVSPRDTYFCKVAKEMAVFSAERQNPCSVPLVDTQILSQILPIDRLPMDKFQEQNLSKCVVIGKGGFGNILLNEMRIASQKVQVAMKVIKSEKLGKASNIDALIQEYKIMRACNHSNIIKVFGYTLYQDTLVIVMEYCEKKTLYRYVLDNKLQMQEKIKLMLQIANGIVFLHSKSICHLDLKPQNILIDSQGVAKLSDFGLSKSVTAKKLSGKTGYTLLYSAPEQIEGQEPGLDADIWAFGNLMYFVCFQKGPIDYVKNPSDNVHSFATKKLVLSELKEKMRKPLIPDSSEGLPICHEFEIRYPKLVHLMRNCWVLDQTLRIKAIKALKTLEKLLEPASL